jgi:uncharacterized protein YabE (DUF348 family)
MANSLNRNLKNGDKVVMESNSPDGIVVTVEGGFGMSASSRGTTIFVNYNGQSMKMDSYEIDKKQTNARFYEENGWGNEDRKLATPAQPVIVEPV